MKKLLLRTSIFLGVLGLSGCSSTNPKPDSNHLESVSEIKELEQDTIGATYKEDTLTLVSEIERTSDSSLTEIDSLPKEELKEIPKHNAPDQSKIDSLKSVKNKQKK